MSSESSKYYSLVEQYLRETIVLDIGSGNSPVVPHAIQVELSKESMTTYRGGEPPSPLIQIHSDTAAMNLPFKTGTIHCSFSAHLIEDGTIEQQRIWMTEWTRVVSPGGFVVILHPDNDRWNHAVAHLGQPVNCAHKNQLAAGQLSRMAKDWKLPLECIEDRLTNLFPNDYGLISCFRRL